MHFVIHIFMFNLPSDPLLRDYWVYEGSLTTPPCSESVTWILYRYPLTISQSQVKHTYNVCSLLKGNSHTFYTSSLLQICGSSTTAYKV